MRLRCVIIIIIYIFYFVGFSSWVIKNRKQSYKMSRCWTKVIKKVKSDQKLVLFYLVNDVVQHSSKKGVTDIVDKFRGAIKDALPHLKEEKIANKVFNICFTFILCFPVIFIMFQGLKFSIRW